MTRSALVALPLVALIFSASPAGALTKKECAASNADGQGSSLDGKLRDAKASFERCVDPTCPSIVRDDCARRLAALDAVQPTVLFDAKDGDGNDLGAVSVTIDGRVLTDKLQGLALPVDPGEHTFAFTTPGASPLVRKFVIKEGEKDRREKIVIGEPTPKVAPPPPPPAGLSGQKILGLSAAGLGAVGVVVGSVFGILTFTLVGDQNSACGTGPHCNASMYGAATSDHSSASTDSTVSTAAFIAGGVFLAAGAALYFTAPTASSSSAQAIRLVPGLGPGGGSLLLRGEF